MCMNLIDIKKEDSKYKEKPLRFLDKGDHYELIFTDEFVYPSSRQFDQSSGSYFIITDIILDMKNADKNKELHIFIGSFGGEVVCLNMIFQQVLSFKYRVGINLGMADSCGWMLYFTCQERYTSKFSQFMYHEMSTFTHGKVKEIERHVNYDKKWWNELIKHTDSEKVLTKEELRLGESTEIYLTGREIIERGFALDYEKYLDRTCLTKENNIFKIKDKLYLKEESGDCYIEYIKSTNKNKFNLNELIKINNER